MSDHCEEIDVWVSFLEHWRRNVIPFIQDEKLIDYLQYLAQNMFSSYLKAQQHRFELESADLLPIITELTAAKDHYTRLFPLKLQKKSYPLDILTALRIKLLHEFSSNGKRVQNQVMVPRLKHLVDRAFRSETDYDEEEAQTLLLLNHLSELQLRTIYEDQFFDLIFEAIQKIIDDVVQESGPSAPILQHCLGQLDGVVVPLVTRVLNEVDKEKWYSRLKSFVYRTVYYAHTEHIFDLIVEFPDSEPALLDVKAYLNEYGDHVELETALKQSLEHRLLHAGANTSDIMELYVLAWKCLYMLGLHEKLKWSILDPIKTYLCGRTHTVRCILMKLLTDTSVNEVVGDDLTVTKILLDIFPEKDRFASEYTSMLAERLFRMSSYDVQREIREVEILKMHFGECVFANADVMLKDVAESRRLFATHQSPSDDIESIQPLIISHLFWPKREFSSNNELDVSEFLPKDLASALEVYEDQFMKTKESRKLKWKNQGVIDLELYYKDQSRTFQVSLVEALVIMEFQNEDVIVYDDLVERTRLPAKVLDRGIDFWKRQEVLITYCSHVIAIQSIPSDALEELYNRIEANMKDGDASADNHHQSTGAMDEEDEESSEIAQLRSGAWPFITAMLTNLGPMGIDRIRQTLGMFAPGQFQCSQHTFQSFLDKMVIEAKLEVQQDTYRMKKG